MDIPKYIPSESEKKQILIDRKEDLQNRGKDHPVYNIDGRIVKLKDSSIWYDNKGKYILPKSSQELECIIS